MCWCHYSSVRPWCVFEILEYFTFRAAGSGSRTRPHAHFERPRVSSLRPGVTTAQSGRVVRWVEPSGRLRSRPESAAVWSWHVPKSAPWLVGRGGNEHHWVSIVVPWEWPRSCPRHVTLRIFTGKQHRGGQFAMAERPAQGCIHAEGDRQTKKRRKAKKGRPNFTECEVNKAREI